jgi:hypothetical protein
MLFKIKFLLQSRFHALKPTKYCFWPPNKSEQIATDNSAYFLYNYTSIPEKFHMTIYGHRFRYGHMSSISNQSYDVRESQRSSSENENKKGLERKITYIHN